VHKYVDGDTNRLWQRRIAFSCWPANEVAASPADDVAMASWQAVALGKSVLLPVYQTSRSTKSTAEQSSEARDTPHTASQTCLWHASHSDDRQLLAPANALLTVV
jgi:hypothetical protein